MIQLEPMYYVIYALVVLCSCLFWCKSIQKYSKSIYGTGFKRVLIGHLIYSVAVLPLGGIIFVPLAIGVLTTGAYGLFFGNGGGAYYFVLGLLSSIWLGQFIYVIPICLALKKSDASTKRGIWVGLCIGFLISVSFCLLIRIPFNLLDPKILIKNISSYIFGVILYISIYSAVILACLWFWYQSHKKYSKAIYGRGFAYVMIGHIVSPIIAIIVGPFSLYLLILSAVMFRIPFFEGDLGWQGILLVYSTVWLSQILYVIPIRWALRKSDAVTKRGIWMGVCLAFLLPACAGLVVTVLDVKEDIILERERKAEDVAEKEAQRVDGHYKDLNKSTENRQSLQGVDKYYDATSVKSTSPSTPPGYDPVEQAKLRQADHLKSSQSLTRSYEEQAQRSNKNYKDGLITKEYCDQQIELIRKTYEHQLQEREKFYQDSESDIKEAEKKIGY